jgi:hypothetical protein
VPPGAKDQRFHGRLRDTELVCDLRVGQPFPFPEQERPAQVGRHLLQRILQADQLVVLPLGGGDSLVHLVEVCRVLEPDPA